MRLNNLCFPGETTLRDIWVLDGKIAGIREAESNATTAGIGGAGPDGTIAGIREAANGRKGDLAPTLDFGGALVFPGLINSHDHLDFNLFPPLRNKVYRNYTEWGPDIHANNSADIRKIMTIPQHLRAQWGMYKNLLNGFTTVVNHGDRLDIQNPAVTVFQDCYCLHSVGFEPRWRWKLNHPAKTGRPFVLHVGEGTDFGACREIDELIRWNLFRRPLIGIHAVAMTEEQATAFHALVWCPASNYFLLDRTAPVNRLLSRVPILFGTDSTLTAGWNAWDQVRLARELRLMTDPELLAMLTSAPADAWRLPDRGKLEPGRSADLVVARPRPGMTGIDAFFSLNPEDLLMVIHEGQVRLFDPALLECITEQGLTSGNFQPSRPNGKYVAGDLPGLMEEIRGYCPDIAFPLLP